MRCGMKESEKTHKKLLHLMQEFVGEEIKLTNETYSGKILVFDYETELVREYELKKKYYEKDGEPKRKREIAKIEGVKKKLAEQEINEEFEDENKTTYRLNLPPIEREELNKIIVREINNYVYAGTGSMNKGFECLANNSKKILNYTLSKGAIEKRYKRNKNKY